MAKQLALRVRHNSRSFHGQLDYVPIRRRHPRPWVIEKKD